MIEKVNHSDWAAPIVVVFKGEGKICICGDYKVSVNQSLDVDAYPLPKPEDLMTSLTGRKKFTKLDLFLAYQQMPLTDESKTFLAINTHHGLNQYTRLPFGVVSASDIFQKAMDEILKGLLNVICYLDDILVPGTSDQEHLRNLQVVLARLTKHGIHLKQSKSVSCRPASPTLVTRLMPVEFTPPQRRWRPFSKPVAQERIRTTFISQFAELLRNVHAESSLFVTST